MRIWQSIKHIGLILLVLTVAVAQAADVKISALTAVTAAAGANEIPVNEAGTTKKVTVTQLGTYLQTIGMPVITHLESAYTNSTLTGTEVTGLSFNGLVAGTYYVKWTLLVQTPATTTSPKFGVNYSGTATSLTMTAQFPSAGVSAATGQISSAVNATTGQVWAYANTVTETTTAPNLGPWTGVVSTNTNTFIKVEGLVVVSDGGDLELWAGSEVDPSTVTLSIGSSGLLIRMN